MKAGQKQVYTADISDLDLSSPTILGVYSRYAQPASIIINSCTETTLSVEFATAIDSKMVGCVAIADIA